MFGESLDRAWSTYWVTMAILAFLCLAQTMLNVPREAWAAALATDAQGYQIDNAPSFTAPGLH
jgi:hypothetical protein